jgi:spore coat protein U-like protein
MGSHPNKIMPLSAAIAAMGLLTVAGGVDDAQAQTTSARAKTVVVSRLAFLNAEELEFGNLLASRTAAGTVIVSPAGVRTATGGVTLVGGLVQPARFAGRGTVNQTVLVSLTTASSTLRRVGGTETMLLDQLTIGSTPTAVLTTTPQSFRISSPTGIFNFPIGGRLNVNANQVPGDYTGTFTVTLNYQ